MLLLPSIFIKSKHMDDMDKYLKRCKLTYFCYVAVAPPYIPFLGFLHCKIHCSDPNLCWRICGKYIHKIYAVFPKNFHKLLFVSLSVCASACCASSTRESVLFTTLSEILKGLLFKTFSCRCAANCYVLFTPEKTSVNFSTICSDAGKVPDLAWTPNIYFY